MDGAALAYLEEFDCDAYKAVEAAARCSRGAFEDFVYNGHLYGVGDDVIAEFAARAWMSGAEGHLEHDKWRYLFNRAGYWELFNRAKKRGFDKPAERPEKPLTLWRPSPPKSRSNWSWMENRRAAYALANPAIRSEVGFGVVWKVTVEPERLFANISDFGGTVEYVVDTDGLDIEPDGLWCGCPVDLEQFRGDDEQVRIALDTHELVTCPRPSSDLVN